MAPVVVNLCGEGEEPGAININLLHPDQLTRKMETILQHGPCVKADATVLPIGTALVDEVLGNMLPYEEEWMTTLVSEVHRILRPGGVCRLWATTTGGAGLMPYLTGAGLSGVVLEAGRATGYKT